jgi:hypothetical protein
MPPIIVRKIVPLTITSIPARGAIPSILKRIEGRSLSGR